MAKTSSFCCAFFSTCSSFFLISVFSVRSFPLARANQDAQVPFILSKTDSANSFLHSWTAASGAMKNLQEDEYFGKMRNDNLSEKNLEELQGKREAKDDASETTKATQIKNEETDSAKQNHKFSKTQKLLHTVNKIENLERTIDESKSIKRSLQASRRNAYSFIDILDRASGSEDNTHSDTHIKNNNEESNNNNDTEEKNKKKETVYDGRNHDGNTSPTETPSIFSSSDSSIFPPSGTPPPPPVLSGPPPTPTFSSSSSSPNDNASASEKKLNGMENNNAEKISEGMKIAMSNRTEEEMLPPVASPCTMQQCTLNNNTALNTNKNDKNHVPPLAKRMHLSEEDTFLAYPLVNLTNNSSSPSMKNSAHIYAFSPHVLRQHNSSVLPVVGWEGGDAVNATYTVSLLANSGNIIKVRITKDEFESMQQGKVLSSKTLPRSNNNNNNNNNVAISVGSNNNNSSGYNNSTYIEEEDSLVGVKTLFGLSDMLGLPDLGRGRPFGLGGGGGGGLFPFLHHRHQMGLPFLNRNAGGFGYGHESMGMTPPNGGYGGGFGFGV